MKSLTRLLVLVFLSFGGIADQKKSSHDVFGFVWSPYGELNIENFEMSSDLLLQVDHLIISGSLVTNGFALKIDAGVLEFRGEGSIRAFTQQASPVAKAPDNVSVPIPRGENNTSEAPKGSDGNPGHQNPGPIEIFALQIRGVPRVDGTGQKGGTGGEGGRGGQGAKGRGGQNGEAFCSSHSGLGQQRSYKHAQRGHPGGKGGKGGVGGKGGHAGKPVPVRVVYGNHIDGNSAILSQTIVSAEGKGGDPGPGGMKGPGGSGGEGGKGARARCVLDTIVIDPESEGDMGESGEIGDPGSEGDTKGLSPDVLIQNVEALVQFKQKTLDEWSLFQMKRWIQTIYSEVKVLLIVLKEEEELENWRLAVRESKEILSKYSDHLKSSCNPNDRSCLAHQRWSIEIQNDVKKILSAVEGLVFSEAELEATKVDLEVEAQLDRAVRACQILRKQKAQSGVFEVYFSKTSRLSLPICDPKVYRQVLSNPSMPVHLESVVNQVSDAILARQLKMFDRWIIQHDSGLLPSKLIFSNFALADIAEREFEPRVVGISNLVSEFLVRTRPTYVGFRVGFGRLESASVPAIKSPQDFLNTMRALNLITRGER